MEDKDRLLEEPVADGRITFHFHEEVIDQKGVSVDVVVWAMKAIKHWGPCRFSPYLIQVCTPTGSHFYSVENIKQIVVQSNSKEYVQDHEVWRFNQELFASGEMN